MAAPTDRRWPRAGVRLAGSLVACGVLALGGCGGTVSTGDLMGQSRSRDSADRAKAVRALGERAAEADAIVPVLVEALKDENAFVRRDAALALGRIGPAARPAAPALQAAMRDRNAHVRRAASEAIQKVKAGSPATPGK